MLIRETAALSILLFVGGCSSRDRGAGTGGIDASGCAKHCFDPNWADWPMPNLAADIAGGAPNLEHLEDHGDGTVTDGVTGLVWQQTAALNAYAWSDAVAFCSALILAGQADWRLPSAIELVSIIDYGHSNPSINRTYFPDTPASAFWSSSFGPTYAWKVDFSDGNTATGDVTGTHDVRCVRRPTPSADASAPAGRFTVAGGTVTDNRTKLIWQQDTPQTPYSWSEAKTYCASGGPGLAGVGWRLPTVRELQTLVDPARMGDPRIDLTAFPNAPSAGFWSSSPAAAAPSLAWLVNFYDGFASKYDITTGVDVRCVR